VEADASVSGAVLLELVGASQCRWHTRRRDRPTAVAVLLIASGAFQQLIARASFFLAANYCVCCLALVALRRRVRAGPAL
jgi:hypothetical protein